MFFGTYEHTMDLKGRVSLPSRFRSRIPEGEELFLVRGYEHCLWLFRNADYMDFLKQIQDANFDKRKRNMKRWFTNGAFNVEVDKAGRIRVPVPMQEYAHLSKSVTVTGNQDHIELWNPSEYQQYLDSTNIDELTDELVADGVLKP